MIVKMMLWVYDLNIDFRIERLMFWKLKYWIMIFRYVK